MKRALISDLHIAAKLRGPGFLEACHSLGRLSRDGQWLTFTDEAHAWLRKQFNPNPPPTRKMPSLYTRAKNLGKAMFLAGKDLFKGKLKQRTRAEIDACLIKCHDCEHFKTDTMHCLRCGCGLNLKTRLHSWHCPLPNPRW